jgi:hypothetical protein
MPEINEQLLCQTLKKIQNSFKTQYIFKNLNNKKKKQTFHTLFVRN